MADRTYLRKVSKFSRSGTTLLAVILLIAITSTLVKPVACTSRLELRNLAAAVTQPELEAPVVVELRPRVSSTQRALLSDCDKYGCQENGVRGPQSGSVRSPPPSN